MNADAGSVTVEQATTGSPDDAEEVGDGTYRYSTVIVVGPAARVTLNPFPASLATVRSLVAVAESLPFLVEVSEAGADATFEVTGNVRETPLMDISVSAASPDEAIESHEIIVGELQDELDDLQAGALIDAEARTQMLPLVEATYPIATATSQVRPVAAIVVLGSGLAVGLATLLEAFAADRRRRRAMTPDPEGLRRPGRDTRGLDRQHGSGVRGWRRCRASRRVRRGPSRRVRGGNGWACRRTGC